MANLEDITVQRYLHSATSLKVSVRAELRKLLATLYSVCGDWSQVMNKTVGLVGGQNNDAVDLLVQQQLGFGFVPQMQYSQPATYGSSGLPVGGGSLTFLEGIDASISIISSVLFDAESVEVPGLYLFQEAVKVLKKCVDNSKAQGISVCPNFFPACQYVKGILVMLLESYGYWEAKMSGQRPGCCIKDMELPTVAWASNNTAAQNFSTNRRQNIPMPLVLPTTSVASAASSSIVSEEERSEQSYQGKTVA